MLRPPYLIDVYTKLSIRDEPFILVRRPGAPGMYANLLRACRAAGFEPHVAFEVERISTNVSLVAAGEGVSVVPASMRDIHSESVVSAASWAPARGWSRR